MSVDLGLVAANWAGLLVAVCVLVTIKTAVLFGLARLFGHDHDTALRTGLTLAQGGEFGFVLYSAAAAARVMTPDHANLLVALVTLSMALTPLVVRLGNPCSAATAAGPSRRRTSPTRGAACWSSASGASGSSPARCCLARGLRLTIIDNDVEMIEAAAPLRLARLLRRRHPAGRAARRGRRPGQADRGLHRRRCDDRQGGGRGAGGLPGHALLRALLRPPPFPGADPPGRGGGGAGNLGVRPALRGGRCWSASGRRASEAERLVADVRRRDRERLEAQAEGGLYAGMEPFASGRSR